MRAIKAIIRFLKLSLTAVAIVAILLGAILGFAAFEKSVTENRESRLAHLDAVLDDYLSVLNAASSNEKPIGTATKAKPVLVCFVGNNNNSFATNRYDKSIDFLTLDLPGDLFPTNSEEVGTIVALYWGQDFVGSYSNGAKAFRETCRVKIYDIDSGHLLAENQFVGGEPPASIKTSSSTNESRTNVFGRGCDTEVIDYVTSLF